MKSILPRIRAALATFLTSCKSSGRRRAEDELKRLERLYAIAQERLDHSAYYDALTGLANRSLFLDRVTQHMLRCAGNGHQLAVFLIDLERFKKFNDSLGRPAGDALLKQVAEWLAQNAGNASVLARVGADHFAVVLPDVTSEGEVFRLLDRTVTAFLSHPFNVNDVVYRIAAKVGVALYPDDGSDADTVFKNAEAALKKAKVSGDRYLLYAPKMTDTVVGSFGIENRLRQALENQEFVLHYQPKVSLATGKLTGVEALIRWNDPKSGLVPPARFIPILEETRLIHEVGRWALAKAIEDYQRWRSLGLPAVRIAVNVSPLQLRSKSFVAQIEEAIGVAPGAAAGLELEITESLIMESIDHSIANLKAIRALGVTIAIDDFGTGSSSLSYLSKLPVHTLKIDHSFIDDMGSGERGLTLVSVIINLAHALKLNVVAEGVETQQQLLKLRGLGCDEMQGYLYGKPVPVDVFQRKYLARVVDQRANVLSHSRVRCGHQDRKQAARKENAATPRSPCTRVAMRLPSLAILFAVSCMVHLLGGCQRDATVIRMQDVPSLGATRLGLGALPSHLEEELNPRLLRRFAAIHRRTEPQDSELVRLGRLLYFEPLLSRTGKISCNSCHPLNDYGVTHTKISIGVDGKLGRRNAPSVYNAAGHFRQFWDGRVETLDEQASGPMGDPSEMGMEVGRVVEELKSIPGYKLPFARAFPGQGDPITLGNATSAIAEFERGLITPARWDRYLDGDSHALTQPEKEGAKLFANLGCMVCHTGAYIGGTMFEKLGVVVPWPNQTDHGRREVTQNSADDMVFKVPSLRNVAMTGPYFHDGSADALDTAVRMMAHHQLGVDLSEEEARSIAAWLGSLTGDIPRDYIAAPTLPAAVRQ